MEIVKISNTDGNPKPFPSLLHMDSLYCLFFLKALAYTLKMLGKNCNPINTHCHWLSSSGLEMVTQTYNIYLSMLTPNICSGSQESDSPEHLFPNCVVAFVSEFFFFPLFFAMQIFSQLLLIKLTWRLLNSEKWYFTTIYNSFIFWTQWIYLCLDWAILLIIHGSGQN